MIDGTLLLSPVIFLSVSQFHVFLPWVNSCLSYILEYESCLQQGECPGRGLVFFKLREGSLAALQQNNLTWGGRQVLSAAARRLLLLGCFAAVREAEQKWEKFPGPTHDGTVFPDEKWWVKFGPRRWRWGCVLVLYHLQFCQDRAAAAGENTYFFICLQTPSPQSSDPDTVHSLNTPNLHIHTFHLPSASIVELVLS